jgi:hypothetical protein
MQGRSIFAATIVISGFPGLQRGLPRLKSQPTGMTGQRPIHHLRHGLFIDPETQADCCESSQGLRIGTFCSVADQSL